MKEVTFTVYGKPQPAGSKRAFVVRKADAPTGRIAVTDANPAAKSWQGTVAAVAAAKMASQGAAELLDGPLGMNVTFFVKRPAGHYGTGRNADLLRQSAPPFPAVRPDATKLMRAVEDALTGVVYRDDAQIVVQTVSKRYGTPERAEITIWRLS